MVGQDLEANARHDRSGPRRRADDLLSQVRPHLAAADDRIRAPPALPRSGGKRLLMLEPMAAMFHPSIPDVFVQHDGHPFRKRADETRSVEGEILREEGDPGGSRPARRNGLRVSSTRRIRKKRPYPGRHLGPPPRRDAEALRPSSRYYNRLGRPARRSRAISCSCATRISTPGPQRQLRRVLDSIGVTGVSDAEIEQAVHFGTLRQHAGNGGVGHAGLQSPSAGQGRSQEESFKTRKGEGRRVICEHLSEEDVRYIDERVADLDPMYGYASLVGRVS